MPTRTRARRSTRRVLGSPGQRNPLLHVEDVADRTLLIPDIIEFTLSDGYLNRSLYPRQGTMLKVAFLQDDLFTEYDHEVIGGWIESFKETGDNGCQPDIYERIRICKAEGRSWFREWVNAIGRRGSKGYIGGIAGAYVLWNYLCRGDPQGHYGIDRDKRLSMLVFAGKKEQAAVNQWKDLKDIILGARCFHPYISRALNESLTVYAPHDVARLASREDAGIYGDDDMATFIILPKESTLMASRGPAVFCEMYDEMAHVVRQNSKADAGEVYESATPALDTFGVDAFIYEPSSTWQMAGKFYENWQQSLAISDGEDGEEKGTILRPEMLMFQLTSWDPYLDWERAPEIPTRPESTHHGKSHGYCYPRQKRAQQTYDKQMERIEASNPETFAVERRSHWAAVLDAYLNQARVEAMFKPWPEINPVNLQMQVRGRMSVIYKAHGDPSKSGANFGFAIAHVEQGIDDEFPHVVFDLITHWSPSDFDYNRNEIDYEAITEELEGYLISFLPAEYTFDQGYSAWIIQQLRKYMKENEARITKRVEVFQRTATAPLNWEVAESFKTALGLGLVHAPPYEMAELELKFLQKTGDQKVDHPTAGPVQTKDVADCIMILVHALIGQQMAAFVGQTLSALTPSASQPTGFPLHPVSQQSDNAPAVAAGLSSFGRGRGHGGYSPARGDRFGTRSKR